MTRSKANSLEALQLARRRQLSSETVGQRRLGGLELFARPLLVVAADGVDGDEEGGRALAVGAFGGVVGFGQDLLFAGRSLSSRKLHDRPGRSSKFSLATSWRARRAHRAGRETGRRSATKAARAGFRRPAGQRGIEIVGRLGVLAEVEVGVAVIVKRAPPVGGLVALARASSSRPAPAENHRSACRPGPGQSPARNRRLCCRARPRVRRAAARSPPPATPGRFPRAPAATQWAGPCRFPRCPPGCRPRAPLAQL